MSRRGEAGAEWGSRGDESVRGTRSCASWDPVRGAEVCESKSVAVQSGESRTLARGVSAPATGDTRHVRFRLQRANASQSRGELMYSLQPLISTGDHLVRRARSSESRHTRERATPRHPSGLAGPRARPAVTSVTPNSLLQDRQTIPGCQPVHGHEGTASSKAPTCAIALFFDNRHRSRPSDSIQMWCSRACV